MTDQSWHSVLPTFTGCHPSTTDRHPQAAYIRRTASLRPDGLVGIEQYGPAASAECHPSARLLRAAEVRPGNALCLILTHDFDTYLISFGQLAASMSQQPGGPSNAASGRGAGNHGEQNVSQMTPSGGSQPLNDLVWCLMADRD